MFTTLAELNWLAIAAGAVASFVLGGLWFTVLFGKAYSRAVGRPHDPKAKSAPIFLIGPFVCGLITTIASAMLIKALKIETTGAAITFGAIAGFGYLTATTVNTAINPNMPRPLLYGLISGGYFLLSGVIVSMLLVALS